ncbi:MULTISPECIES: hypothetical protein [Planotetraspora]|uniref:Secreted protein n=2 Tax=Planotetraspora TaxID=58120 RepID=A0A8J3UMC3_9ACTN|nr:MULTISPECIES: hypothetical protein [Planotetraspora]GII31303.1 hypothetical protein Pmi06nite_47450 [Planotetraspora mira]GII48538.1 hypothetical protein Psi02_49620 [Planotetraspora silvatica]
MERRLAKAAGAGIIALPLVLGLSGPAHAETNPSCSSVTQIGTTAYVTTGGQTFASVKQFKGCNKNWAYLYVWEGYRSSHSSWHACTTIATTTAAGAGNHVQDVRCNSGKFTELWSSGAATLSDCTVAVGWIGYGPLPETGEPLGRTSVRC